MLMLMLICKRDMDTAGERQRHAAGVWNEVIRKNTKNTLGASGSCVSYPQSSVQWDLIAFRKWILCGAASNIIIHFWLINASVFELLNFHYVNEKHYIVDFSSVFEPHSCNLNVYTTFYVFTVFLFRCMTRERDYISLNRKSWTWNKTSACTSY